jgi:hypothetical protein
MVNPDPATVTLGASPTSSVFGKTVTLTATVTATGPGAGMPSGSVSFFLGSPSGTPLGMQGISSGQAAITTSILPAGTDTIVAVYSGDSDFSSGPGGSLSYVVAPAGTSTAVTSSNNPSAVGQSVTFTATVSNTTQGGGPTPVGSVVFSIDSGAQTSPPTTLSGGQATFTVSNLALGSHTVTATFTGSNFAGSTSPTLSQVVKAASTTTLTSSQSPANLGTPVTFTATVSGALGTPTGTVTFVIDGTPQTTPVNLVGGMATSTAVTLPGGTHQITATYSGDNVYAPGGTTSPFNQVVNPAGTSTSISTSPTSSVFGQPVTLTANIAVTGPGTGTPNGSTVSFYINSPASGNLLGTGNVSNSTASITTTALPEGSDTIIAVYAGDNSFIGSTGELDGYQVGQNGTTLSLSAAPNPSSFGQSVMLTATVTAASPGIVPPDGGTVTFYDGVGAGATQIGSGTVSNGVATATTNPNALSLGTHNLSAVYTGDANFTGSSGELDGFNVGQDATTTSVSGTSTTSVFGQGVTFTATVSSAFGTPGGSVTFSIDGTPQTTSVGLSGGQAQITLSSLPVGLHHIGATYNGTTIFLGSSANPTAPLNVTADATTTSVTASPTSSLFGQSVTLTATIAVTGPGVGPATSGTVSFFAGTGVNKVSLGTSGSVSGGTASITTTLIPVGVNQTITAVYSGSTNFQGSTGTLAAGFTTTQESTTTTVAAAPTSAVFGQNVVFTATVTSQFGTPDSTVTFIVDGKPQTTTVALNSSGKASLTLNNLSVGTHSVGVAYNGDKSFAASTAATPASVTVGPANTVTTITESAANVLFGQNVVFTASVAAVSPGGGIPTGTIGFVIDGLYVTSAVALNSSGKASLNMSTFGPGTHYVGAIYTPTTANYLSSFTTVTPFVWATLNVGQASTTTTIAETTATAGFGQAVTFTAVVAPVSPAGGTPTGTVTFLLDGAFLLAPTAVSNGTASITFNTLSVGTHYMAAIYNGDTNFKTSFTPATPVFLWATLNVVKGTPAISIASSAPAGAAFGTTLTFTAVVAPPSAGAVHPTGQVAFFVDNTFVGFYPLNDAGQATFSTAALTEGFHSITVGYAGDSNYNVTFAPAPITQLVFAVPTSLFTFVTSPGGLFANRPFTITAAVLDGENVLYPLSNFPATIYVLSAPVGATLAGPLTATVQNGEVTFGADPTQPLFFTAPGEYQLAIVVGNLTTFLTLDTVGRQL